MALFLENGIGVESIEQEANAWKIQEDQVLSNGTEEDEGKNGRGLIRIQIPDSNRNQQKNSS